MGQRGKGDVVGGWDGMGLRVERRGKRAEGWGVRKGLRGRSEAEGEGNKASDRCIPLLVAAQSRQICRSAGWL